MSTVYACHSNISRPPCRNGIKRDITNSVSRLNIVLHLEIIKWRCILEVFHSYEVEGPLPVALLAAVKECGGLSMWLLSGRTARSVQ